MTSFHAPSNDSTPEVGKLPLTQNEVTEVLAVWAEKDLRARFLVTTDRQIVWHNCTAQTSRKKYGLVIKGGALCGVDSSTTEKVADFLQEVALSEHLCTTAIIAPDGDGCLLMRGRSLGQANSEPIVGLEVYSTSGETRPQWIDFGSVFGLTPMEKKVVCAVLEGSTAEEIAQQHGGSIQTIRTHIRSIYAKLDVGSREKLFFRLRPFAIT